MFTICLIALRRISSYNTHIVLLTAWYHVLPKKCGILLAIGGGMTFVLSCIIG
jgi:hypothetical protein